VKPELVQAAKHRLEDILSFFEINAEVTVTSGEDTIELAVVSEGGGRLIGHRGEVLAAIQHLMNMMIRRDTLERVYVHVDIGGYREARLAKLEEQAQAAAERVRTEGVEVPLPMMNAAERRHIHSAMGEVIGVTTESRGEGSHRRLVVKPATE
jgi:spoIIIJ-associated protein